MNNYGYPDFKKGIDRFIAETSFRPLSEKKPLFGVEWYDAQQDTPGFNHRIAVFGNKKSYLLYRYAFNQSDSKPQEWEPYENGHVILGVVYRRFSALKWYPVFQVISRGDLRNQISEGGLHALQGS